MESTQKTDSDNSDNSDNSDEPKSILESSIIIKHDYCKNFSKNNLEEKNKDSEKIIDKNDYDNLIGKNIHSNCSFCCKNIYNTLKKYFKCLK